EAHRRNPLAEHIPAIAELLDDAHPHVRVRARQVLVEDALKAGHDALVRREATRLVGTSRWRGLEPAVIVLTLLDHRAAAPRFVDRWHLGRPEVCLAAAWGLRKLAVPEPLVAQLKEIERRWERSQKFEPDARDMVDLEVAQLAQSLGQARYAPAMRTLARF